METDEEIRQAIYEAVRQIVREYLESAALHEFGEAAARAINEKRRAQGKPELDL